MGTARGRNGVRGLIALAASLAALQGAAAAAAGRLGIDLEAGGVSPYTPLERDDAIRDPHALECESCHAAAAGDGRRPLRTGDDSVRLCLECHPEGNLHPVGVTPAAGLPEAAGLPLGSGALAGEITCLTCHYLHRAAGHQRHLLRSRATAGGTRMKTLCAACHGTRLTEKSPHSGSEEACRLCHMNRPQAGAGFAGLAPNVQAICNFCHDALDNRHFLALDPFTDEYLFPGTTEVDIPKIKGRFTCISCHDPHAAAGRVKLLRERYLQLAALSKKINPHWKNVMCASCHEGEPASGAPRLKEGGDTIRLCYRCHAFKYSRSDIHPINCVPSRAVTVPAGMPLKNGRLTCETCHDSSLQEGGERPGSVRRQNPKFLRGGFTTRGEFCLRCHQRQQLSRIDPHSSRDASGRTDEVKCLFCHSSVPGEQAGWVVRLQFDEVAANELCLLCHPQRYQDEHPLAPHFVEPSSAIARAMESAEERVGVALPMIGERIACITCHDPHRRGDEPGAAPAAAGAVAHAGRGARRLRVGAGICAGCHLTK